MCGQFTQLSSWQDVHAFSQPLTLPSGRHQLLVSTPMRFANFMRLNPNGDRELIPPHILQQIEPVAAHDLSDPAG